jgi:hypothetical protein
VWKKAQPTDRRRSRSAENSWHVYQTHRSAEPGSLVVCVDFADRAVLLAEAPDVYYVTDHYLGYPSVLVRLSRVSPEVLRDLLGMAYKFVNTARALKRRKPRAER